MAIFDKLTQKLRKKQPWYDLATVLAIPHLIRIRNDMRKNNLHDTEEPPLRKRSPEEPVPPEHWDSRSVDGIYNDLSCPHMGAAGRRLGRNFPLEETRPDTENLLNPSPREVSRALMTRTEFQPASILNLFAAAWIQFMVHDWFVHKQSDGRTIDVQLKDGDPWPANPMKIKATEPDPAPEGSTRPPAYANLNSHWWDASQIYGTDTETAKKLRSFEDGKLKLTESGRLFLDPDSGTEITGFADNGWVGLSLLHTLFAREHNAICDMLKAANPDKDDQWLYCKARLINAAILAKIHTMEWTTAILPHRTTQLALRTNWQGIAGENLQEVFSFLDDSELLGGILGSTAEHHAAPYSLTEEFTSVYRMHALMPDEFVIRSQKTGDELNRYTLPEVLGRKGQEVLDKHTFTDLIYSFGISHPGAIRLHNYPKHLQDLTTDKGDRLDLATIDILRDRERGVPRYNRFRRLLGKDPVKTFEELTDNPVWREEIRQMYDGDLEKVDLMVGLYAEPLPNGFGFSETAFRIFILMASRRLKSDRFFTDDYRPEIYTEEGLAWVKANGFASILKRHYPDVTTGLKAGQNPFAPWKKMAAGASAGKS